MGGARVRRPRPPRPRRPATRQSRRQRRVVPVAATRHARRRGGPDCRGHTDVRGVAVVARASVHGCAAGREADGDHQPGRHREPHRLHPLPGAVRAASDLEARRVPGGPLGPRRTSLAGRAIRIRPADSARDAAGHRRCVGQGPRTRCRCAPRLQLHHREFRAALYARPRAIRRHRRRPAGPQGRRWPRHRWQAGRAPGSERAGRGLRRQR